MKPSRIKRPSLPLLACLAMLAGCSTARMDSQWIDRSFHDGLAHVVFGRDQFDVIFLALLFGVDRRQQCIVVTLKLVLLAEHRISPGSDVDNALSLRW